MKSSKDLKMKCVKKLELKIECGPKTRLRMTCRAENPEVETECLHCKNQLVKSYLISHFKDF
jgi:hypothetical protein